MWIPRWLGEIYSRLFTTFGGEVFTFTEALRDSGTKEENLLVAFSRLHREGVLTIFERTKPRRYRILDPVNFILIASGLCKPLRLRQERYARLIYDLFRCIQTIHPIDLVSVAVYGSVARGTARPDSDLDLLIVHRGLPRRFGERIEVLTRATTTTTTAAVQTELGWLLNHGFATVPSMYPLTPEEVSKHPSILLDLTLEALVVYDKGGFLQGELERLRTDLASSRAKRLQHDDDDDDDGRHWYWDLTPDYQDGEVIQPWSR